jgi:hypothetical protein
LTGPSLSRPFRPEKIAFLFKYSELMNIRKPGKFPSADPENYEQQLLSLSQRSMGVTPRLEIFGSISLSIIENIEGKKRPKTDLYLINREFRR